MPVEGFHSALCLLQCTPAEFVAISKSLIKLMKHVQSNKEVATNKLESPLLRNLFTEVTRGLPCLASFIYIHCINQGRRRSGNGWGKNLSKVREQSKNFILSQGKLIV